MAGIPSYIQKLRAVVKSQLVNAERSIDLLGMLAVENLRRRDSLCSLADAEFCVYSQWGEDGILEWLLQRLPIWPECFVEFGVENYTEANTRFLLKHRNWKGVVIDGSAQNVQYIRNDSIYWRHDLTAICEVVTRENINEILLDNGLSGDIGILSIDIDGNDYWVWEVINMVNPQIVICEYNAVLGDVHALTIPYEPMFHRTAAHHSNLYFGCSINGLCNLALQKGYTLVGTNQTGCNAFFVRNDILLKMKGSIDDRYPKPSRMRESRDRRGRLTYLNGLDRFSEIKHLPIFNLDAKVVMPLSEITSVYSDRWLREMGFSNR